MELHFFLSDTTKFPTIIFSMIKKFLEPIKALKLAYLPLLAVYFAAGFMSLSAVTRVFFFRNHISLSAADLISLGIWINLPWSIKMVFGTIIDGVPILGSHRKAYIYLGSILIAIGCLSMADIASTRYLVSYIGEYGSLLFSGLFTTSGVVMSNIVASTMCVEVIEKDDKYDYNLSMVQVLTRLMFALGAIFAAAITGYLAAHFQPATVFTMGLIIPAILITASSLVKFKQIDLKKQLNKPILLGGLGLGAFCVVAGLTLGEYSQLAVFCASMIVINIMLWRLVRDMDPKIRKPFIITCIAIFLFRTVPGAGPAVSWWYIGDLKFDEEFMGKMSFISELFGLTVLWILSGTLASSSVKKVMWVLTIVATILSLPDILVYYHLHEQFGFATRNVILIENALGGPLGNISMIPLGVLIAKNAPPEKRALYFSLIASFMNMALVAGDLLTKWLNTVYTVTRTDFTQLGTLMIAALVISTVLSLVGLLLLKD